MTTPPNNQEKCQKCHKKGCPRDDTCNAPIKEYCNKLVHDIIENQHSMNNQQPFIPQDTEKRWLENRKNLFDMATKYSGAIMDCLDAAYLAGLDDKQSLISQTRAEILRKIRRYIESELKNGYEAQTIVEMLQNEYIIEDIIEAESSIGIGQATKDSLQAPTEPEV